MTTEYIANTTQLIYRLLPFSYQEVICELTNFNPRRIDFSENELNEIASALECDLKITFTDKKSGKEFSS